MGPQFASGDTTDITLTLAHLMATTDLTGLQAASLSAPVRGLAGDARLAGVAGVAALDAILIGMTEGSAIVVSTGALTAGALMGEVLTAEALTVAALTVAALPTVRRASAAVMGSTATEDFMVEAVGSTAVAWPTVAAASTAVAAEGSTVVAVVDTAAADTGNRNVVVDPAS
jgi:hypothetical protein